MINPFRKRVIGLVIIAVFLAFIVGSAIITGLYSEGFFNPLFENDEEMLVKGESDYKSAGIEDAVSKLADDLDLAYEEYYSQLQVRADITAKALYRTISDNGDEAITRIGDGFVIKFDGDRVKIPDGLRADVMRTAKKIEGTKGHIEYLVNDDGTTRKDTFVYSRIKGPYYYAEIVSEWELTDYVSMHVNYVGVLEGIEQAFNLRLYVFANDWANNPHLRFLNNETVYIGDADFWDSLGEANLAQITTGSVTPLPTSAQELIDMTPEQRQLLNNRFVANAQTSTNIRFIVKNMEALDCTFIMVFAENDAVKRIEEQVSMELFVILLLGLTFMVWLTSVQKEIYNGTITNQKREKYAPAKVRLITVSYGILSALIVLAVSFYNQSLGSVYQENIALRKNLDALELRLKSLSDEQRFKKEKKKELYIEYAQRVAELLEAYPEINNKEDLKEINKEMGTAFIMLFDANGREVSTSSNYINMELGAEDAPNPSRTADFRRILKGVPSIVHEKEMVEEVGRKLELVGVRTNDKVNGGYGVLLLAVDTNSDVEFDWQLAVGEAMKSMTPEGKLIFAVDKEDLISSASDDVFSYSWLEDVTDKDIETIRRDGINDFINLNGLTYYGVTRVFEEDDHIYFAGTPNAMLFANGMRMSVMGMAGYMLMFLVLSAYLMFGYTDKSMLNAMERQEGAEGQVPRRISAYARAKAVILSRFGCTTPEKKARLVVILGIVVSLLLQVNGTLLSHNNQAQNYVFSYIMSGQWGKGLNLFAFTAAGLLLISMLILMLVVRVILSTVAAMLNPRGKTICRLISNMFNYIGILVFLYFALSYIGVDTNAILASVGVLGIGLSMGARDIIADVLAGVSTIVEGEFQVGDIVEIDGYRGMVQEIGARSTKVIGRGGNIKIIGNKNIKNVTNLTKLNSWVAITIRVDVTYSLTDVETLLSQTLPRLGKDHKEIISGPYYKGVLAIEGGFAVLSIIAECKEDNYHKVERILNREVLLTLRNNNIPVR